MYVLNPISAVTTLFLYCQSERMVLVLCFICYFAYSECGFVSLCDLASVILCTVCPRYNAVFGVHHTEPGYNRAEAH